MAVITVALQRVLLDLEAVDGVCDESLVTNTRRPRFRMAGG
jgi:hypothetical protein